MKKLLYIFLILISSIDLMAQAKKPKIMVVPARQWCIKNGFYTESNNFGTLEKIPDYNRAFDENVDLLNVITTINGLFLDRGFQLTDLSQVLNSLKQNQAENAAMSADQEMGGKTAITESLYDKVRNVAKADIVIEITWDVVANGPQKYVTFTMRGLDSYTDKSVASPAPETSAPSFTTPMVVLLKEAALKTIDNFNVQLQNHFDDLFANGREIKVEFRRFDGWDKNFETEFAGDELNMKLEDWFAEHTVKGRFTTGNVSENQVVFDQVRIPMFDENQRAIDARTYARQIQKLLKAEPYNIEAKIVAKGLGYVQIICGGK
jgi:hypothetical protein